MELTIFERHGMLYADSRDVAAMVGKSHKHLLRDIGRYIAALKKSTEPKIGPSEFFVARIYKDSTGRELPCYGCSKMGCEMIAHKLTGDKGIIFTAVYVKQFNEMEKALLERQSPDWQTARQESKKTRRLETDAIKQFVEYAYLQGSQNAKKYYISFSVLADNTVGIPPKSCDHATTDQILNLRMVEGIIDKAILQGMEQELFYKDVFKAVKRRLEEFVTIALLVPQTVVALKV